MKRDYIALMALVVCLLLTGCSSHGSEAKTLVDDGAVRITTQAHEISVYDKGGGAAYNFRPVLKRRSESATAPRTMVQTNTIKVISRPGGGLVVLTANKKYEIWRK